MTEKIFVKPGVGRRMPLPLPGDAGPAGSVPAEGCLVDLNYHVRRLLNNGDLVACDAPANAAPVVLRTKRYPAPEKPPQDVPQPATAAPGASKEK